MLVLTGRDLERVFPAFVAVGSDGVILSAGPSVLRLLGESLIGSSFDEVFEVERPRRARGFKNAARCSGQMMLLARNTGLRLQGVSFERTDRVIFALGHVLHLQEDSPKLSHRDFSPADSSADAYLAAVVHSRFADEVRTLAYELEVARGVAEAANRAKTAFMANVSHELRTPLNAIIGYSELLRETAADQALTEVVADLDHVLCAAKGLEALVSEVLDYSRLEERRSAVEIEPFNVADLLHSLIDDVRPFVEANGNRLTAGRAELPIVLGDEQKLYRCLRHLLCNAGHFTKRGEIRISARLESSASEHWLAFDVSDTGAGMSDEALENLTQALARGGSEALTRGDARLSLALTQRIAETLGGELLIRSEVGVGSVFTLRSPVALAACDRAA